MVFDASHSTDYRHVHSLPLFRERIVPKIAHLRGVFFARMDMASKAVVFDLLVAFIFCRD